MHIISLLGLVACLWAGSTWAQEPQPSTSVGDGQPKTLSGMSVLGNNEAPKSLVIVPWKSSQIGDGIGVVNSLDHRPMPVDREVFTRELTYYRLRTNGSEERNDGTSDAVRVGSR